MIQGQPYAFVSEPFRELLMGRYGRLPGPADPAVFETVARGEQAASNRPAEYVTKIDLDKVYQENADLIRSPRDLLLLLLFPVSGQTIP